MSSQKLEELLKLLRKDISFTNDIQHGVQLIEQSFREVERQNIEDNEKEQIKFVIARVASFLLNKDKYSCITSARSLLKYLQYKLPLVQQLAVTELCMFLRVSTLVLISEKDTDKIEEMSKELDELLAEITEVINDGDMPLSLSSRIQEAIRFANLGLTVSEIGTNRIGSSDEFLNSAMRSSVDRLVHDFNLIDLLQKHTGENVKEVITDQ